MADELDLIASLIERLLSDPPLRRRFRANAPTVLRESGLGRLAADLPPGHRALETLEVRESRSSLAGMMVAAAAEGVDFVHLAEHEVPRLERQAAADFEDLIKSFEHHHPAAKHPAGDAVKLPQLAPRPAQPSPGSPPQPATPGIASASSSLPPAAPSSAPGHASSYPAANSAHRSVAAQNALAVADNAHDATHSPNLWDYPGDNATPQQIAAWMGYHAKAAGLPPELPVMAALTESGLRNVDYGDRDSVGFFQMRRGIWDNGEFAGYLQHPRLQLKWFIEHALAARDADPTLAASPKTWGEWIANVEQPAAQFRYRYQLQLESAHQLLQGVDLGASAAAGPVHATVGAEALQVAMRYLGTPYQWGGSSPATGFDCSGLVQYAFAQEGIHLPRVAADQFDVGIPVPRSELRPGDAVFFADPSGYVHHVGIYIGDGRFINAPETGEDVKISSLSEPYFAAQYAGARRFTEASVATPSNYARTLPVVSPSGAPGAP